jgi:hypothetical protein
MPHVRRMLLVSLLLLLSLVAAGCGGSAAPAPLPEAGLPGGPAAGLPGLSKLPQPQRTLSTLGPGYFDLALDELVDSSGVTGDAISITLDGGTATAYALFGLAGFDGDNGPTSARVTASAVSSEYYVAFSDYTGGTWSIVGPYTGSAEVDMPNSDDYTNPSAYTSELGACYLAILTGPGDSTTLTKVELGVQGGEQAPLPPIDFTASGAAPDFYVQWAQSPDYHDPDFSGYILQRAPALAGDYIDLGPGVITASYLLDPTALDDVLYRYRICAVDVSGNRSVWRSIVDGPQVGALPDPLLVLDLPHGPLYGPVTVDFDFSGSSDPAGEGIASYAIDFAIAPAPVSSVTPQFSVLLQPGCYVINAKVECTGPPLRDTTQRYTLMVYPQWEAAPVVVREPVAPSMFDTRRLQWATGTINPAAQRLTYCGIDMAATSIAFWSAPADSPASLQMTRLPLYQFPTGAADAMDAGSQTYFTYTAGDNLIFAYFDGSTAGQIVSEVSPSSGKVAAATDGTHLWGFFDNFDGFVTNLDVQTMPDGVRWTAVSGMGNITAIDALYNPDTAMVDVVYSGPASTEWVRLNMVTQTVDDSANIDAVPANDIDLELDPATGRPILLYAHSLRSRFTALDGTNTWSAPVLVDNSVNNYWPADLITDDGVRYAYFRTGPAGQAVLYKEDAGVWAAANTVAFSANSAIDIALLPQTGQPDRALVLDMAETRVTHLAQLHDDGTDTEVWSLPAADGQGTELHAADGLDGLHAVWRSFGTNTLRHALSIDGGASWSDPGDIGISKLNPDIAADDTGNVYLSIWNAGNAELYWWDGATFNLKQSFPCDSNNRPFFSSQLGNPTGWCAYENATTTMHYVEADEPTYTDNPQVMSTSPIWEGVANYTGIDQLWFGCCGGATAADGFVCWSMEGASEVAPIYEPLFSGSLDLFSTPLTGGRTFGSVTYYGVSGIEAPQRMFTTRARLLNPIAYTSPFFGSPEMEEIHLGRDYSLFTLDSIYNEEMRNTVACAMGWSVTGIVYLCSGDGSRNYFAWSSFGDWQELPLPEGIDHQSMPQLVVGMDGRWHILYLNWLTGQLMCISTL